MSDARALYEQGQAHFAEQRWDEAAACFQAVLTVKPYDARAQTALGNTYLALKRCEEAIGAFERASELRPDVGEPHHNRGVALARLGRFAAAFEAFATSVRVEPSMFEGHDSLIRAAIDAGAVVRMQCLYEDLARDEPEVAAVHYGRSMSLYLRGLHADAIDAMVRAAALDPEHAPVQKHAGWMLYGARRLQEARPFLERATVDDPDDAVSLTMLALVHESKLHLARAERAFRQALHIDPDLQIAQVGLAQHLLRTERADDALALLERARAQSPDDPRVVTSLVSVEDRRHRTEQARALLQPFLDRHADTPAVALSAALVARNEAERRQAAGLLEDALAAAREPGLQRALSFALAKVLDRLGEWERAFRLLERANALKQPHHDPAEADRFMDRLVDAFSAERWPDLARARRIDGRRPIFIVGMPRSGTTLAEQIVGSHPEVEPMGERTDLVRLAHALSARVGTNLVWPEVIRRADAAALDDLAADYLAAVGVPGRFTDKMPHNFERLGLIALAFPGARIVHCVRDWRDTCVSIWFQDFVGRHDYAYDQAHLGRYYRSYRRLMAHWRRLGIDWFELDYESLVDKPEQTVGALLEALDLPWDARCLAFHTSRRQIYTASHKQVREPLYARSVGRWRHYEPWLGPLLEEGP